MYVNVFACIWLWWGVVRKWREKRGEAFSMAMVSTAREWDIFLVLLWASHLTFSRSCGWEYSVPSRWARASLIHSVLVLLSTRVLVPSLHLAGFLKKEHWTQFNLQVGESGYQGGNLGRGNQDWEGSKMLLIDSISTSGSQLLNITPKIGQQGFGIKWDKL